MYTKSFFILQETQSSTIQNENQIVQQIEYQNAAKAISLFQFYW